jgi:uncharacterized coiled-coil DUF342 family protein
LYEVEQKNNKLKNDLEQLKFVLDFKMDSMTLNIRKWGAEKNALDKEVKKLEQHIVELPKDDDKHNAKLKTIKSMCDKLIIIIYRLRFF